MAAYKQYHRPLVCKACMKLKIHLSVHLRQACKRTADESVIRQYVEEAKANSHKLLQSLSLVPYGCLDYRKSRYSDPQEFFADFLAQRGCIIPDKPITMQTFETDEEEKSENKDDVTDFNFDDSSLRKKLSKVGVYQRHDVNSLVLDSFGRYLQNYFGDYSIKQMLYSVSCYLYFINPDEISLDFLNDLEKTQKYVTTLLGVKASVSTIKNRLNHIEHFIKFVISEDFPNDVDEDKKQAAETFLKGLRRLKANVRPVPKKGPKQCRHRIRGDLTPKESCRVLTVSESLVMDLFAQARSGSELEVMDKMLAWYYLKALLLLKYLYKPAVLHNLTVKSWLERKSYTHREGSVTKTVAIIKTRRKIILLQPEEEKLFETYFKFIRPTPLVKNAKTVERFFLSSKGRATTNIFNEMIRFHKRLDQPPVTGRDARLSFNKWLRDNLSKEDTDTVKYFMNHNVKDEIDMSKMMKAISILSNLADGNHKDGSETSRSEKRKRADGGEEEEERNEEGGEDEDVEEMLVNVKEQCYMKLLESHPVLLEAHPPTIETCLQITQKHAQYLAHKWRAMQLRNRMNTVIDHFSSAPTEMQVSEYIKEQGWDTNVPRSSDIVQVWWSLDCQRKKNSQQYIEAMVQSQEWRGLVIVEDHNNGRHSLKTTQIFKKGDFVCDYHGVLMEEKDEEEIQKSLEDETRYILFFEEKGKKRCLNAVKAPCECHPHMASTFGRLINHSHKQGNVRPVLKYVQDGKKPVILFEAKKDLPPGTELLFSYGV